MPDCTEAPCEYEIMTTPPYSIGSDTLPGLAKLAEEIGELQQVIGKIMGIGHVGQHWDGLNLTEKLVEEIADVRAAVQFFVMQNLHDRAAEIDSRFWAKFTQFRQYHCEAQDRGAVEPVDAHPRTSEGYALMRDTIGELHVFEIDGNRCRRAIVGPGTLVKWGALNRTHILTPICSTALEALQYKDTHS